ncbi:MAG: M20/M25/M40 family metallo-hydrolase, partial [Planctomycetota bacterium]
GRNLWTRIGTGRPTLLLNAHLDTVPATDQWTRPPHEPAIEDDRMYGLGCSDDKASIAAMAAAVVALKDAGIEGSIVFAATCDEETGGEGLEVLRREIPPPDAAVIGEPTDLRVATCQRGLIRIQAVAEGRAAHAARPHEGENAIDKAIECIRAAKKFNFVKMHPLLGLPTIEATLIEGGVARNMIPPTCTFTLDVRTTPEYDNDFLVIELRRRIKAQIPVLKGRIMPVETPSDDPLVVAALDATATSEPVGFGGVSDLFHVRDLPSIVLGPGEPPQSHQPDESIPLAQVCRAVDVYSTLARSWMETRMARRF